MCFNYAHRKGKTTTCRRQFHWLAASFIPGDTINRFCLNLLLQFLCSTDTAIAANQGRPPPGHVPIIRKLSSGAAITMSRRNRFMSHSSPPKEKTESRRPTQFVSICGTLRSCGLEILSAIASHVDTWRHQHVTLTGFQQTRTDSRLTSRVCVNKNFPLHKSSTWSQVNFTRFFHITSNEIIYS